MPKTILYSVLVLCSAFSGYRRAGFKLCNGSNALEGVTAAQLTALKADARLAVSEVSEVSEIEPNSSTQTSEIVDKNVLLHTVSEPELNYDNEVKQLSKKTVPDLRDIASALTLQNYKDLSKPDLVKLIAAEKVRRVGGKV